MKRGVSDSNEYFETARRSSTYDQTADARAHMAMDMAGSDGSSHGRLAMRLSLGRRRPGALALG